MKISCFHHSSVLYAGKSGGRFYNRKALHFLGFFAAHCGQGTHHPNSATGTTMNYSIDFVLPLHCNNKYIDFEKLLEFDLGGLEPCSGSDPAGVVCVQWGWMPIPPCEILE
jgi:hypothetical protein